MKTFRYKRPPWTEVLFQAPYVQLVSYATHQRNSYHRRRPPSLLFPKINQQKYQRPAQHMNKSHNRKYNIYSNVSKLTAAASSQTIYIKWYFFKFSKHYTFYYGFCSCVVQRTDLFKNSFSTWWISCQSFIRNKAFLLSCKDSINFSSSNTLLINAVRRTLKQ